MTQPLVLSLFPGIGLLDRAFEEEGFCVVRGPDLLWGGDVRSFHPPVGRFDGIIGGPPCQRWSALANIVRAVHGEDSVAPDLIPEYERVVSEAAPSWFLMENVPKAPQPTVPWYVVRDVLVNNRMFGGEQNRERRFSFGTADGTPLDASSIMASVRAFASKWEPAVCSTAGGRRASRRDRRQREAEGESGPRRRRETPQPHHGRRVRAARSARGFPLRRAVHRRGQASGSRQRRPAPDGPRDRASRQGVDVSRDHRGIRMTLDFSAHPIAFADARDSFKALRALGVRAIDGDTIVAVVAVIETIPGGGRGFTDVARALVEQGLADEVTP